MCKICYIVFDDCLLLLKQDEIHFRSSLLLHNICACSMDWYDRKIRRNTFRLAWLILLLAGTYFLYSYYRKENLSDYQMQNSYTGLKRAGSVRHSETRTLVATLPPVDSVRPASVTDSSSYARINPLPEQKPPVEDKPVITSQSNTADTKEKEAGSTPALQGPSAVFSGTYTIVIGKTVPVNVAWTEDGMKASHYKLITIKADNITGNKARFTIEDPFNVLLFSQTGYGVNDKIIISDDRHNLDIRVMKVSVNSVMVNVVSHLNDALISKLQKMQ